jgi:hypothetical protein
MLQIGDRVQIMADGHIGIITNWNWNSKFNSLFYSIDGGYNGCRYSESQLIKINEQVKNKTMNIKEKFVLAITPEPKKSFRKVEITNGDDILTEDGQKIFLTWLLHNKFAEEFKKEVVDDMLKELEEENK